jgi:hypothetical protein
VSIASPLIRPSPNGRRVGIRIVTFKACSGFTHVTARRMAQPPEAAFVTRLQPCRSADRTARQPPDQSTTLWVNLPPLVIRAFGTHCQQETYAPQQTASLFTSSARLSNVAGISMPSALAILSGVNNRVLNYREFSFGPNCAFRFNFQRVAQRGQASYVVAVMAPSDFAQL